MAGWTNLTPSGGVLSAGNAYLYESSGALVYQGTSGSASTLVNADGTIPSFGTAAVISTADVTTASGSGTTLSPFAAANDTLTLAANRTYYFEGLYVASTVYGGISGNNLTLEFTFSSAPAAGDFFYEFLCVPQTAGPLNAATNRAGYVTTTGVTTASASSPSNVGYLLKFSGIFRSTATGGTLIPKFGGAGVSGNTATVAKNSWFRVTDLGSNTVTLINGSWA